MQIFIASQESARYSSPRGMVLIAVLWIVAALSILVTGMMHAVRGEVRQISLASQMAQGASLGGAAIQQAIQSLAAQAQRPPGLIRAVVNFQGRDIEVLSRPLSGLIDINTATLPLLEKLFTVAGELPSQQASQLAQAVLDARGLKDPQGRALRFESVEDLMGVPGIDYELYVKLVDLVTADAQSNGRVNVSAAPTGVLNVLAAGNLALAQRIAQDRDAGVVGVDTTGLDSSLVDNAPSRRYLVQARVPLPDGGRLLTERWVDLNDGRRDGLPWRVFHSDTRTQPPSGP